MTHIMSLYEDDWLCAHHLLGRDVDVQISKVKQGTVIGEKGRKQKKPVIWFVGKQLGLALCKTNSRTIASMHGSDFELWPGKWITLYPTTTDARGAVVECVRIRPQPPHIPPSSEPAQEQKE